MRFVARIACGLLLVVSAQAQVIPGCELLLLGFERAQAPRFNAAQSQLNPAPRILVDSIRRGFDDGKASQCSNAGALTLMIDPADVSPTDVYSFEAAAGALPNGLLPAGYVRPLDFGDGQYGFRLYWLDLPPGRNQLEALNAVIRINRVSLAGERSEPALLPIIDAGGVAASTSQSWDSVIFWVAVAFALLVVVGVRQKVFRRPAAQNSELAAIQNRLRELAAEKAASRANEKDRSERPAE